MLRIIVFPEDQGMSYEEEEYPKYCTILPISVQGLLCCSGDPARVTIARNL